MCRSRLSKSAAMKNACRPRSPRRPRRICCILPIKRLRLSYSLQRSATRPCPEAWYGIYRLAIKPGPMNKQKYCKAKITIDYHSHFDVLFFSCLNRWAGLGGLLLAGEVSVGIVRRLDFDQKDGHRRHMAFIVS